MKISRNHINREEARELYHNKGLPIEELASHYGRSERTIYRWLKKNYQEKSLDQQNTKKTYTRSRKYAPEIFNRII